jgi:hypothetical protein
MTYSAAEEIEAWAEVVKAVLGGLPPDLEIAVIAKVQENNAKKQTERQTRSGDLHTITARELIENSRNSASFRLRDRIDQLTSETIQRLTRDIANSHSPEDAATILFQQHPNGPGSGWLPDYLDKLLGLKVDRSQTARLAERAKKFYERLRHTCQDT